MKSMLRNLIKHNSFYKNIVRLKHEKGDACIPKAKINQEVNILVYIRNLGIN